jgi:ABC-type branched-subunit amino acid transport system substrate-binding protein
MILGGCSSNPFGPSTTGAIGPGTSDGPRDRTPQKEPAKVGLLLPLTASPQTAAIAKAMQQAAELALFERPESGLQLIVRDDKGSPEGAKAAADDVLKAGAELIIGPVFSRLVQPVAQTGKARNVSVVAFSNDPAAAGHGAYLLSFLAETEINRVIEYAGRNGKSVFAALVPKDGEGKIAEPTFRAAVARAGGRVAFVETYDVDQGGIVEPGRKLKDLFRDGEAGGGMPDALFIPAGPETLSQISYLIGQAKIDTGRVKLLGTTGWDHPNVGRDPRLAGAWFAGPDPRGWRDFAARFTKAYGHMPPRLASLAFDAVDIAAALASQPKDARFSAQSLTRPSGFVGVDGPVRFTASGRSERGLAVLEVQKTGPTVVDGAPAAIPGTSPLADTRTPRSAAGLN